jgi:VWFA-related protein
MSVAPGAQQQAPQPPAPAFRSRVDLLTVQASVMDKDGRPVRDLQAADFSVAVDGQPRKVVFARFSGASATGVYAPATAAAASVGGTTAVPGRLVMFVVDRDTIRPGAEKALLTTSASVLDALTPADAAGVLGLPTGGLKPTRDHQRVRDALSEMTGTMPGVSWRWTITWAEAEGIERGDKQMLAQALERECRPPPRPPADCPECPTRVPEGCLNNLPAQAQQMLLTARSQARATLSNLRALNDRLRPMRGPKHIVLMSGGLRFDQEMLGEFNQFVREAATAGVVFHTIHIDQMDADVSTGLRPITSAFGSREMSGGLTTIAGMTGGAFFAGVGTASGAFERIRTEITNYYELGLETVAADADGNPRSLNVKVNRDDVRVRARSQVALDPSVAVRTPTAEALRILLEQPTDVVDLPLQVNAYTTRGDDPSLLKVLVSAQIGSGPARTPAQWGFIVLNEGNVIASGRSSVDGPQPSPLMITASAKLLPGKQRLRFAAIDGDGRVGVVEMPLTVGLRVAGDFQLSDLIVGSAAGGRFLPSATVASGAPLAAMIEVLSNDVARLAKTRVALEIIPGGATEPVQRVLMAARTGIADTILVNEAQINTASLQPGRYSVIATVLTDSQPVGKVTRTFEVVTAVTSR